MAPVTFRAPDVEAKTGALYTQIQRQYAQDPKALARLRALLTTSYLQVPHEYFRGKRCLDVGCGATGRSMWAMVQMGASVVHGLELDPGFAPQLLLTNAEVRHRFHLVAGSVLTLPYEDATFDYVNCEGVLHHCPGDDLPYVGFKELARVTRPGGMILVTLSGRGGILNWLTRPVHALARRLDPGRLERLLAAVFSDSDKRTTVMSNLCPPIYEYRFTERQVRGWFESLGFVDVRRLVRYPHYDNYRQYLAPLYYNYRWLLARALYGEGYIQMRGTKATR